MEDTLLIGDFLLVNKAVYGAHLPGTDIRLPGFTDVNRRDIIVFEYPDPYNEYDPDPDYVKRVVGVPGDRLEMREKTLYVNGDPQDESYARYIDGSDTQYRPQFAWQREHLARGQSRGLPPVARRLGPIVAASYFVMGDNRDNLPTAGTGVRPETSIRQAADRLLRRSSTPIPGWMKCVQ
jgi:signal peptidase I